MIVISGITSALGIRLAKLLAAQGKRVLGFARRIDRVQNLLAHPLIELHAADLNNTPLIQSFCLGAEGIVHLAALSSPWGSYADFYRVNVEGTRSILDAAFQGKVKRFVHISTPSIYFDFKDRFDLLETEISKKNVNAYAETKKLAEAEVDGAFSQKNLSVITLRPRAIFGPHDQTVFPRILKASKEGGIPRFGKKSPLVDITYVDNVVQAIELALYADDSCLGEKYNITNGEPAFLDEILEFLFQKLSLPLKRKNVPYPLAYFAAWLSEMKGRLLAKEPILTRYSVGVLAHSQTLCIEKAKRELGYEPKISLKEGIKRYADWIQTT
jgi:nucleoside-diphosphate-sugar epimerase